MAKENKAIRYPNQFRLDCLAVFESRRSEFKSQTEATRTIASELNIAHQTLRRWLHQADPSYQAERQQPRRLKKSDYIEKCRQLEEQLASAREFQKKQEEKVKALQIVLNLYITNARPVPESITQQIGEMA